MGRIELKEAVKIYNEGKPNAVRALSGVNLTVESGESVAVMGVSGSGKSTLLHIVGCLDSLTGGTYRLDNKDISAYTGGEKAALRNEKFGFVLQDYGLLLDDRVTENVALPLYFSDKYRSKQIATRVEEILEQVGLLKELGRVTLKKRKVCELSGGQRQRVAIARAIVNEPDIILADEPTGALDSNTAKEIMAILTELNACGKTVILVTHDRIMADYMSRTVYLSDGKMTGESPS